MTMEEEEGSLDEILDSLYVLGLHHPERVLLIYYDHLAQYTKLTASQGTLLLESMGNIIKNTLDQISQSLAQKILSLSAVCVTKPTWPHAGSQQAASNLLVTMSSRFTDEVVHLLMESFKQGHHPQVYVVKTLSKMSTENPYSMVPFLKHILGAMFPTLFRTKQEEMKSAFATALGNFSKSILIYLSSVEKTSDPLVTTETFSTEINTIYSLLFKVWLEKEPPKLMLTIVEALGYVTLLLPRERLEKELPKLIPTIVSLYKKHPAHSSVTRCLYQVLDIAIKINSLELKTQMGNLLKNLHQQICLSVGSKNFLGGKNHGEILRCFTLLAPAYADILVDFLLPRLDSVEQQTRLGTLSILRHLISSASSHLAQKAAAIVAAMKPVLVDKCSNQEKKLAAQLICAMAQQNYIQAEDGKVMVEFLVRQCAAALDSGTPAGPSHQSEQVTDEDLVTVCETVMFMITNTAKMENVLWAVLLDYVTLTQYTKALTTICNCLAHLGKKKLQSGMGKFMLMYKTDSSPQKAQELLARLLLLSCCPFEAGSRGAAALRLLQVLGSSIHPAIASEWDRDLSALVGQLQEHSKETLPEEEWEEKLLLLLSKTLTSINDEEWIHPLSEEIYRHIEIVCHSAQKAFLYKALGVVFSQLHSTNVKEDLLKMLLSVQPSERVEREGVAVAFGLASMSHFDDALDCLQEFAHAERNKNTKCSSGVHGDRVDVDMVSTLVLCYGNMALYAPEEQALPRIESHILPAVIQFIPDRQGMTAEYGNGSLQLSLIHTITLIAKSLEVNSQRVLLSKKRELLQCMQDFMEAEPTQLLQSPVRQQAITACTHLIKLSSESNHSDTLPVIHTCLASTFSLLPAEMHRGNTGGNADTLYAEIVKALKEFLKQILIQDPTPECFQAMFKQIEVWIISTKEHERERAMDTALELLRYYLEEVPVNDVMLLPDLGAVIGRLMPQCADPSLAVRQMSVDSLHMMLAIQVPYQDTYLDQQSEQLEVLKAVREELVNPSPSLLLQACRQIAEIISKSLPQDQLGKLLLAVFTRLSDQQPSCASAAAVLTGTITATQGRELKGQVSEILEALRSELQSVTLRVEVRLSALRSIAILASYNPKAVVDHLLTYPAPLDSYTSQLWQSLAEYTQGSPTIMKELVDTLKQQLLHWEKQIHSIHENKTPQPSHECLVSVCALHEMISTPESAEVVTELFPELFSVLLVHLRSFVEISSPSVFDPNCPTKQKEFLVKPLTLRSKDICVTCVQALKALMGQVNQQKLVKCMEENGGWNQMIDLYRSHAGVAILAKEMASCACPSLSGIVEQVIALIPILQECQKVTTASFLGEILRSPLMTKLDLTDTLVSKLLQCLVNSSTALQAVCVRALGNITVGDPLNTEKYSQQVLCAMIYLMESEQRDNEVLMFEVLSCLGKHLNLLKASAVKPSIIKIFTATQTFFDASNERVRAEAFNVFGNLAKCGTRDPKSFLCRQIHGNLVRLLLQLDARSEELSSSCNMTLHLVAPLVVSAKAFSLIENYVGEPTLNYIEFLRAISQQLMKDFPEKVHSYITDCISFFNRPEEQLRANAITLSGLFFQRPEKHTQSARKIT
ncbi:maestro heat-like repeat-containing protein family member 1 [Hypanus sabinus]|uniref:maestro heat-like repeat-containing protein family member 1 n=1 Tax=Hypanus sabinus TaxID=79690 RepID=UPI0028C484B2|nr:maestro heat-like repeat-containing protein family member 1 [Hypanus sabinus]